VSNQTRCQIEQQFIHQPLTQQRAVQLETRFGVNLVDTALCQQFKQGFQVNLAGRVIQNFDEISG